ncbi:hypothetical protein Tco_0332097, partial [Tanacetum coccineum]
NDIRAERIAKSANPLALLAAAQPYSDNYYQAPKPQRSNATSSSTRPMSEEDSDPEQVQRDKDMQKNLALLVKYFKRLYKPTNNNLRTSSYSRNKTEDTKCNKRGYNALTVRDLALFQRNAGAKALLKTKILVSRGKMMMCKQAEQGVPLQAEQADWLADTDEEIDEHEIGSNIIEVLPKESSSTEQPLEQVQNNDENNVFVDERQHSENNTAKCTDERVALANLIANLTLDIKENKMILKQLKKANTSLTQELEECKTNLDETSRALGEATRLLALKDIEIKEGLKTKAYEISVLNQKHDELVKKSLLTKSQLEGYLKEKTKVISDLKVKEEKDIDKMIEMDKQLKFLNEIVYTRNQSIQTIHMLAPKLQFLSFSLNSLSSFSL